MPHCITIRALDAIRSAAARAHPHEACGLLFGTDARIESALPCTNVAGDPLTRFEIDPAALIAAHRSARSGGPALVGYFHSHPVGHPLPSATDCDHASGDGRIWAIAARGEVTLWRDTPAGFVPLFCRTVAA